MKFSVCNMISSVNTTQMLYKLVISEHISTTTGTGTHKSTGECYIHCTKSERK